MKRDETHRKFQCVGLRMCRLGIEVPSSRLACERARGGGCNPHFSPQLLFFSSVELMTASDTAALGTSSCFLSLAFTSTGVGRPQRRHGTRDVHIRLLAAIKSSRSLALERGILHHGRHTRTRLALGSSPPMQCQVSITPYVLPAPSIARAGRVAAPLRPERGLARAGGRAGHQRATSADSVNDRFALDGINMFRHFGENQIFHVNTYIFANFTQITTTFFFHYSNTYTYMMIMILTMTSTIILTQ